MSNTRKPRRWGPTLLVRFIHPGVVLTLTTLILMRMTWSEHAWDGTRSIEAVLLAALVPLTLQAMAGTRGMADRPLIQGLFALGLALLVSMALAGSAWHPSLQLSVTALGAALILAGQHRSRRI